MSSPFFLKTLFLSEWGFLLFIRKTFLESSQNVGSIQKSAGKPKLSINMLV